MCQLCVNSILTADSAHWNPHKKEPAILERTPEQVDALLAHIDPRGHFMRRHTTHQHALADPRAREIMRRYFADETTDSWHEVVEQIAQLGLDERTTRALQAWIRSLRRTRWCWADQHPEACQTLLDPTIVPVDAEPRDTRFGESAIAVPAGWVPVANQLHRDITNLVGPYEVIQAGQKHCGLRWLTTVDTCDDVRELIAQAHRRTEDLCGVCGAPRDPDQRNPPRCREHPLGVVPFAVARPPRRR